MVGKAAQGNNLCRVVSRMNESRRRQQMEALTDPVDVWIGERLSTMRESQGKDAAELAKTLGVSVEEYLLLESGTLRIEPPQLVQLARELQCSMAFFFEGLVKQTAQSAGRPAHELPGPVSEQLQRLSRIFPKIVSNSEREYVIQLAAGFAAPPNGK